MGESGAVAWRGEGLPEVVEVCARSELGAQLGGVGSVDREKCLWIGRRGVL